MCYSPDAAYTRVRMDFFTGQQLALSHTSLAASMSAIIDCFEYDNSPLNFFLHLPGFSHLLSPSNSDNTAILIQIGKKCLYSPND